MLSTTKDTFDLDVFKYSGGLFEKRLIIFEAELSEPVGAKSIWLEFDWNKKKDTVEVDEVILTSWKREDFFIDLS